MTKYFYYWVYCSNLLSKNRIRVMKQAPSFTLPDEHGVMHSLSDYKGKKVVIYFYPKDETPGCTKQACSIRDNFDIYQKHNIIVLGINTDTVESHKKFKEHHKLPFVLLSDTDGAVAKKYGALSSLLGIVQYAQRKTYLVNEDGNIIHTFEQVNIATQTDDILKAFGF